MNSFDDSRMTACAVQTSYLHALNLYYFETMLMLIVILWLLKWLFSCQPAVSSASGQII